MPDLKKCPSCGEAVRVGARFCPDCGVSIPSETPDPRDLRIADLEARLLKLEGPPAGSGSSDEDL